MERRNIMCDITIKKSKMNIGTAKDIENALALKEKYEAFMEYIAICDHPEIMEGDIEEAEE